MKNTKLKSTLFSVLVYILMAAGCLVLVTWIGKLSFENTCIELKKESISNEVRDQVRSIENSINFGKDLENYYGMDDVLAEICNISKGNLEVVILDSGQNPIYNSMEKSDGSISTLAQIYDSKNQKKISQVTQKDAPGTVIELGKQECMVFPIYKNDTDLSGHLAVVYDKNTLKGTPQKTGWTAHILIWLIASALILASRLAVMHRGDSGKWYIRYLPVAIIMSAMLSYILYMYSDYSDKYRDMVDSHAQLTADYIQNSVDSLQKKGLLLDNLDYVSEYINNMVANNQVVGSISAVKNYYNTKTDAGNMFGTVISLPVKDGEAYVNIIVNQDFIEEKLDSMSLAFGAIFIICLMIAYELTRVLELIEARMRSDFGTESRMQKKALPPQIRVISFFSYTALYTSMPYAAVLMRKWNAAVWGFSEAVSASLPLTIELFCVLSASLLIQTVFKDSRLKSLLWLTYPVLILANAACGWVDSPYMLIGLRALCGVGFAFLKYGLNSYVAAASDEPEEIRKNYAQLNGGLLCGITVGASLGSIFSDSKGYQFDYIFTAVLCAVILVLALVLLPWKMIDERRRKAASAIKQSSVSFRRLISDKSVLLTVLLGDIPLNIGLMYVVSFLPVYASAIGHSGVITSYAFIVNGIAGVYLGVVLIAVLKKVSPNLGSFLSLAMGAGGILVLVAGKNAGIVLLSAGILGLFDGYGTPTITSFFTGLPAVRKADTAGMLTIFNSVGSAVQIACPLLYNSIIQPDGKTTYLFVFGICFAVTAVLFRLFLRGSNSTHVKEKEK